MDKTDLEGAVLADRFRLETHIAQGGYGAIFRGVQLSVDRPCAVKVLSPDLCSEDNTEERFRIEARMTSRLNHPNTVVLYDFGCDADRSLLFLAMELLDGQSVKELVETNGPLPVAEVARIVEQAAASLREAHEQGAIHRDVKPNNVMLVERRNESRFVKVIDFGIAKALRADTNLKQSLTKTGMMIGSPAYMAPEQIRATDMDGRTDEYGLGMMTYFMLTGETPFGGGTSIQVASRHLTEEPPAPTDLRPERDLDAAVERVVMRAVAKRREDRFEHVEAYAEALVDAVERANGPMAARPSPESPGDTGAIDGRFESHGCGGDGPSGCSDESTGAGDDASPEAVGTRAVPQTQWAKPAGAETGAGYDGESIAVTAEIPDDDTAATADGVRRPDRSGAEQSVIRRGLFGIAGVAGLMLGAAVIFAGLYGGEEKAGRSVEGVPGDSVDVGVAVGGDDTSFRGDGSTAVAMRRGEESRLDVASGASAARPGEESTDERAASSERGPEPPETEKAGSETRDEAGVGQEFDADQAGGSVEPSVGRIEVRMMPWGTLLVDGEPVGNGSTVEARVPAGRHRLEMQQDGEIVDRKTVRVESRRRTSVELVSP